MRDPGLKGDDANIDIFEHVPTERDELRLSARRAAAVAHAQRALEAYRAGDFRRALEALDDAVEADASYFPAWRLSAYAAWRAGDERRAHESARHYLVEASARMDELSSAHDELIDLTTMSAGVAARARLLVDEIEVLGHEMNRLHAWVNSHDPSAPAAETFYRKAPDPEARSRWTEAPELGLDGEDAPGRTILRRLTGAERMGAASTPAPVRAAEATRPPAPLSSHLRLHPDRAPRRVLERLEREIGAWAPRVELLALDGNLESTVERLNEKVRPRGWEIEAASMSSDPLRPDAGYRLRRLATSQRTSHPQKAAVG